jgi:hypothetical protein
MPVESKQWKNTIHLIINTFGMSIEMPRAYLKMLKMKKIKFYLVLTLCILVSSLNAQNSNLVIFSEDGEPFTVMLNGMRENAYPQSNVRMIGLNTVPYKVKIIFANPDLGSVDKTVYLDDFKEVTYSLRKKTESEFARGARKAGHNLAKELNLNKQDSVSNKGEWYVMRLLSVAEIDNVGSIIPPPSPYMDSNNQPGGTTNPNATQPNQSGGSFSMNVNISENSANVDVNVQEEGTSHSTNVDVNTSGTNVNSRNNARQSNPSTSSSSSTAGCIHTMRDSDFNEAKNSIASKTFEDTKMQIAKQVAQSNCFKTSQVKEIMMLFTFEESKLEFAKYAYDYTFDVGNYYKVNDAFTFESSIDDLNAHIKRKNR